MRQRAMWSAVLVVGLALAGCGSASDSGKSTSSDGKLGGLGLEVRRRRPPESYLEKAKADFEKKHPDVEVEFVAQPFDQYYTLLGAAIQSGKGPDVMLFNGGGQIRDRVDALVPLDDYVAEDKQRLAGWDAFTKDGKTYAAPVTLQGYPIYYNKAIYRKAGLDPDEPADHLGRVRRRLRRDRQGRRQVLRPRQQGGRRHPVLAVRPRLGHPHAGRSTTPGSPASATGTRPTSSGSSSSGRRPTTTG